MVLTERLYNVCQRDKKLLNTVSGIMVDLLNNAEKKTTNTFETDEDVNCVISTILKKYRNACLPYKGIQNTQIVLKNPDKATNHRYSSSDRLMSNVEKRKRNISTITISRKKYSKRKNRSDITGSLIIQNNERIESCSFCQVNHRITTCMKKLDYGKG